jgi:hypothetical protein
MKITKSRKTRFGVAAPKRVFLFFSVVGGARISFEGIRENASEFIVFRFILVKAAVTRYNLYEVQK